jgi:DNA ligase-1
MSDAKASIAQIDKLRGDWSSLAKASLAPKERKRLEERAKATRAAQRAAARAHKSVDKLRAASRRRAAALVSEAFSVAPCYHTLVSALLERGVWRLLEATGVRAGVPVQPMAASASPSIEAALARLVGRPFLCEWKYDGERCQAHLLPPSEAEVAERSRVRLYSRSLDEVSARFPEIVDALPTALGAVMGADGTHVPTSSAVVDAELCAIDEATGEVLPFQSLAARPRKAPTDAQLAAGPRVCVFAFDLLELNGVSLLNEPLRERRQKLRALLRPIPHRVQLAQGVEVSNEQELRDELERAFEAQAEGLMLKCLVPGGAALPQAAEGAAEQGVAAGAGYEAGKRSLQWLKLKRDYLDGMGDSFDLVPIGAYMGRGKRAGAYGAYLLAVYSPETKLYQPICKLGSGLSDVELARWSEQAEAHACTEEEARELYDLPGTLPPLMAPHVWLRPRVVWEVSAAEVSISPVYRAAFGLVAEDKGLALRFPRFVRERPDKGPAQATTDGQLASVFNTQPTASAREGVGGAGPGEVEGV